MAKGGWTRETSRKWNQQKLRVDNVGRKVGNPRKSPPFCHSLRWKPCGRRSRFPGKRLMSSIADVEKETSGRARRGSLLDTRARLESGSTICCGDTSGKSAAWLWSLKTRLTVKKAQAVFSLCVPGHWPRAWRLVQALRYVHPPSLGRFANMPIAGKCSGHACWCRLKMFALKIECFCVKY